MEKPMSKIPEAPKVGQPTFSYPTLIEECENLIDITEILRMVEFLERDELGVRIFQMALQICKEVLAKYDSSLFDYNRLNHSGSQRLSGNPIVVSDSNFQSLLDWNKYMPQNPDGLFRLKIKLPSQGSIFVVIQYESDGHDKKSDEFLQVFRKISQGIDLQLSWKDSNTVSFFESHGTFCIRSNLCKIMIDKEQQHPLIHWMYHFTKSHIYTILLIFEDIWFNKNSLLKKNKESQVFDHCFYIGAFTLNFSSNSVGLDHTDEKLSDFNESKRYMDAGIKEKQNFPINQKKSESKMISGYNLPYPILKNSKNETPKWQHNLEYSLSTMHHMWFFDNLQIQCISFERARVTSDSELRGMIHVKFIRESILRNSTNPEFFTDAKDPEEGPNKKYDSDIILLNLLSTAENTFLRKTARCKITDTRFHQNSLNWDLGSLGPNRQVIGINGNQTFLGLNSLKMELRNEPHKYRDRQVFDLKKNFMYQDSLRNCAIASLDQTLPPLDSSVAQYIQNFNIPNAELFCRMLRIPNILALRELARQTKDNGIDKQYSALLKTMPLGTQTELIYLFTKLRSEFDVVLNPSSFKTDRRTQGTSAFEFLRTANQSFDLGLGEEEMLEYSLSAVKKEEDASDSDSDNDLDDIVNELNNLLSLS